MFIPGLFKIVRQLLHTYSQSTCPQSHCCIDHWLGQHTHPQLISNSHTEWKASLTSAVLHTLTDRGHTFIIYKFDKTAFLTTEKRIKTERKTGSNSEIRIILSNVESSSGVFLEIINKLFRFGIKQNLKKMPFRRKSDCLAWSSMSFILLVKQEF